jgi:hypothetical protein
VAARFVLLLVMAGLVAGGVALVRRHDNATPHAQRTTTTTAATTTGAVLGSTTGATITVPSQPTTTVPHLPPAMQTIPTTTPTPAGDIATESDAQARKDLEAFLVTRPELEPYEDAIWYSAHYSYSNVTPKGLAGLVWCVGFRIAACNRANDAAQR